MVRPVLTFLAALSVLTPAALAESLFQDFVPIAPGDDASFRDASPALSRLVTGTEPRPREPQHFCVIAYRGAEDASPAASPPSHAWVYWRNRHQLIFWPGGGEPEEALLWSPRKLDLDEDVVATEDDIGGSTYLVSRAWVAARLADCKDKGASYTIQAP